MRTTIRAFPFLAGLLLSSLAPPARAGDDAQAEELLRRGQVAQQVDGDVERALDLYARALDAAEGGEVAKRAAFGLGRLQETAGRRDDAWETFTLVTDRFTDILTDEEKQEVHLALLRLWSIQRGSTFRTPVAEIIVVPGGGGGAATGAVVDAEGRFVLGAQVSPLEQKIREMFERYENAPADSRASAFHGLQQALGAVGTAALPVLERLIRDRGPEAAEFAAQEYGRIGREAAIPGLERLYREGDALVRSAVLAGFRSIPTTPESTRTALIESLDRLSAREDLSETERTALRYRLSQALTPAERLARMDADPEDASWWLAGALAEKAEGAFERALERVAAGGEEAKETLRSLLPLLSPSNRDRYPVDRLDLETAERALDLIAEPPCEEMEADAMVSLVGRIEEAGGADRARPAREKAWRVIEQPGAVESAALERFFQLHLPLPASLLGDEAFADAFFRRIAGSRRANWIGSAGIPSLGDAFWTALFRTLPRLDTEEARTVVFAFDPLFPGGRQLPPEAYDRAWIDVHLRLPKDPTRELAPAYVWKAAARSGDPRFLDLVRELTIGRGWPTWRGTAPESWLIDYRGPGLAAWAEVALADPAAPAQARRNVLRALALAPGATGRDLLVRIASNSGDPEAARALDLLDDVGAVDAVLRIAEAVRASPDAVDSGYRYALMRAIGNLHLREGIPYLLQEFQSGDPSISKFAAEIMDGIRAWHQRVREFEDFAEKRTPDDEAAETRRLVDLLGDEDAQVRRAAALALGALGRAEALERLVRLGKEDGDPTVREAALRAVEKIAADR